MHHVALDRPRPHDRDLDDEIVEFLRLEARQHRHLRAALDLEHAERVGALQHAVDGLFFLRDRREREEAFFVAALRRRAKRQAVMRLGELERLAQAGQHAEPEHVDLEDAERVEIVLVPFDEGAVLHRAVADRHHLVEPAAGDDEAADVLGEMARERLDLVDQRAHLLDARTVDVDAGALELGGAHRAAAHAPDRGGERADGVLAQPESLADFADRRAAAIGDDGRGDAGMVASVALVDVLDHLLAPLVLEIDVDVGRLAAILGDEALEQQAAFARVDVGDAQAVADRRVRRRAAALAEDVLAARIADDVMHGEEVGRVIELPDQRQLMREGLADLVGDALGIARGGAVPGQVDERVLRRREARAHLLGIFVAQLVERERQRSVELHASPRSPPAHRGTGAPSPRAA